MSPNTRYRPMSPSGSRMVDPMRASTGTVQLNSSHDPYDSRPVYPSHPPTVPYVVTAYDPRYFREGGVEARPVSSKTYRDPGHSTKIRTEYAIRPRQRSSTTSAADTHLAPGRLYGSSSRDSPVITTSHRRSPSPLPGHEHHQMPSSSSRRHRRHPLSISHIDYASDTGRLGSDDRPLHSPVAYSAYDSNRRSRYPPTGGLRKGEDIDDYDAYSYTNPREQFEKDSAARLRYGRDLHARERPLSLTGADDPQLLPKTEHRSPRPLPSTRGHDHLEWDPRLRRYTHGGAESDADVAHRRSRHRNPISLHQEADEGYSSYRDDYGDGRRHRRRHRRHDDERSSRHAYEEDASKPGSSKNPAPPASGAGLGTAGLGSVYDNYDHSERHRSRDHDHRGHHDRPRRQSRRRIQSDSDAYTSEEEPRKYKRVPSVHRRPAGSDGSASGSERTSQHLMVERRPRHRSHSRPRTRDGPATKDEGQDDNKPESPGSKDSDTPPKGILKTPTDKFPEEPNPVREGVAPLKDAHKKGIPPGARWTKVDRRLVNPAALEAGRERFEERPDYVIVLRVLTKEEIQAYAVKTQEIREERYHEYVQERRQRRAESRRRGHPMGDFSSDDEDDDDETPLAIEDKPTESKSLPRASNQMSEPLKSAA
ncbi:hypothetical protein BDV25DRAFT_151739 [Aspergillus avenaceus]|uniref:DUF8035 domain-containing protein n=1 Tax=Aspergillus avenaceus TaxID=36643 RepID=A0A5N6U065_ASPAV|nr:hypothetical protein BDV25DRAFT_151739 [Aspergillus avenaceus]